MSTSTHAAPPSEVAPRRLIDRTPDHDDDLVLGRRGRLLLAVVALALWPVGELLSLTGAGLGPVLVALYLYLAPGLALTLHAPVRRVHTFALLTVALGPAVTVLVSFPFALTGLWRPDAGAVLLGALTAAGLAAAVVRAVRSGSEDPVGPPAPDAPPAGSGLRRWGPSLASAGALLLALLTSGLQHGLARPSGVVLASGPVWWVAGALLVGALLLAWRWRSSLAVPVLALTSVVPLSQAAMYAMPTVIVTGRHLGMVDYLVVNGRLDMTSDIYHAWSGLFTSAALVITAAGVENTFTFAAWWGALAAPVMVLGVRTLAGRFLRTSRAWFAGLIFGLASSLTTSFFAPQVLAFIWSLTLFSLLLGSSTDSGRRSGRAVTWASLGAAALLSVALAVTHQLSPYMVFGALVVLVVFGRVRPIWAPLIPLVPAVAWALANLSLVSRHLSVDTLGQVTTNIAPPSHPEQPLGLALANRLAFGLPAVALLVIGVVALVVLLRTRNRTTWALALASASPIALVFGTNYGQELIFRVTLFALPWLAVLACYPVAPEAAPTPRWRRVLFAPAVVALALVQLVGLSAMDWSRVIRPDDVAAVRYFETEAPAGSVMLTLGSNATVPSQATHRYQEVYYTSREALLEDTPLPQYPPVTGPDYDPAADLDGIERVLLEGTGATGRYILVSDSTAAYDQLYGHQAVPDYDRLAAEMVDRPGWDEVFTSGSTRLYRSEDAE